MCRRSCVFDSCHIPDIGVWKRLCHDAMCVVVHYQEATLHDRAKQSEGCIEYPDGYHQLWSSSHVPKQWARRTAKPIIARDLAFPRSWQFKTRDNRKRGVEGVELKDLADFSQKLRNGICRVNRPVRVDYMLCLVTVCFYRSARKSEHRRRGGGGKKHLRKFLIWLLFTRDLIEF